jgi:hypothetical protein
MTLDTIIPIAGGYDAAMKDPLKFINQSPGRGAYNPGSYEDYIAAHPPMSFLDSVKGTLKVAAPFILPGLPGLGTAIGTSIGLTGTAATVVGNAVINTTINGGDIVKGVVSAAIPVLGQEVAGTIASSLVDSGMDKVLANSAGKIISSAGAAAVQGKDPLSALVAGGLSEGIPAITKDIPGFSDLPDFAKKSVNAAITAELSGKDPTQAAINSAISAGNKAMSSVNGPGNMNEFRENLIPGYFESGGKGYVGPTIQDTTGLDEGPTIPVNEAPTFNVVDQLLNSGVPTIQDTTGLDEGPIIPVDRTPATTRSLNGTDVAKALEDAGLTNTDQQESVFDPTYGGEFGEVVGESVFDPTFGGKLPLEEDVPEMVITPKPDIGESVFDPTFGGELPLEEDVPEIEIVGDRDKTQEHVFDPTFGGELPLDDLPYLPTDDDFVPTDEIEEPEIPGTTPGRSKPVVKSPATTKPGTTTKPKTSTTTDTKTGTTPATDVVTNLFNQQRTSNTDLLNLLGSKPELANIKSYKELFGEDLFGGSYVPPSAGGAQPEDFANYGRGDESSTASQDEGEDQFFRGGHIDDFDVNALLQILRS